ncbi:MAG: ribosome assembly RNA-binding protein YhbY [Pseudomonadales bacterium]|nr:ribosome assembly RNA-binding protein YhbY [Pseudomonadales bacterium]
MTLSADDKKHYRSIGHQLKPVVLLGAHGVTEPLLQEIQRALDDHELIKVRINGEDRESREAAIASIVQATGAIAVQRIGKILLLLRRTEKPNPRLSNLMRHTRA